MGNDVPIYVTPKGVQAANQLSKMINQLVNSNKFKGDKELFSYLNSVVQCKYDLHFDITSSVIKANSKWTLPTNNQIILNINNSGVYGFFYTAKDNSFHQGIGSTISCKARLTDHLSSFKDHRTLQFMHKFVVNDKGSNLS
jgi:hypothetical protein